jgi:hypothetical protein
MDLSNDATGLYSMADILLCDVYGRYVCGATLATSGLLLSASLMFNRVSIATL